MERIVTVPFMANTIDAKIGDVVKIEEYSNLNLTVKVFGKEIGGFGATTNAGFVNKQWLFMHTKAI